MLSPRRSIQLLGVISAPDLLPQHARIALARCRVRRDGTRRPARPACRAPMSCQQQTNSTSRYSQPHRHTVSMDGYKALVLLCGNAVFTAIWNPSTPNKQIWLVSLLEHRNLGASTIPGTKVWERTTEGLCLSGPLCKSLLCCKDISDFLVLSAELSRGVRRPVGGPSLTLLD